MSENIAVSENIIECQDLVKIYISDDLKCMALQGLDLNVKRGEMLAIIGKSGSGKSTLLNIIGGLEIPTTGKILVDGEDISEYKEKQRCRYRSRTIGFVWQNSSRNLLQYLTACENVESISYFEHLPKSKKRARALEVLELVGLKDKAYKYPRELSGGEQQRVAIAKALFSEPGIILADEPTGAVDSKTSSEILELFRKINKEKNITFVIVTHDLALAAKVDRVVMISDGKISTEKMQEAEEVSVLDRANRVKLSDDVLAEAGIDSDRVKVSVVDGKITIERRD